MITPDFILRCSALVASLIIIGSIICLPLYKWRVRQFITSSLFTKIIWWVPIFTVLIVILYGQTFAAILVVLFVIFAASKEFINNHGGKSTIARIYFLAFIFLVAHLALWFVFLSGSATLLAAVCFASVLSDVVAFFMGNYTGKHKLPRWINNHKSWEGVFGQLIGAGVGGLLVWLILQVPLPAFVVGSIGVASALGDIVNSIAKRRLRIKDWGQTIPGHGGMLDRMSSLSAALAASLWLLVIVP